MNYEMTRNGDMLSVDDIIECLAIKLIGIVPDDKKVTISTNKGEPIVLDEKSVAGIAFKDIARRIMGEEVAYESLDGSSRGDKGFFASLRKIFKGI